MKMAALKKWHCLAIALSFAALVVLSAFLCAAAAQQRTTQAGIALESSAEIMQLNLRQKFNYTDDLAAVLAADGTAEHFMDAAARLVQRHPECLSVELIEGSTLTQVYPGGPSATQRVGTDIANMNYAYTLPRVTDALAIEGPLASGDQEVFLVIQPLFSSENVYVGEVVVAIKASAIMESFPFETLKKSGYEYELWSLLLLDGSKNPLALSSDNVDFSKALETKFELPTVWTLSIIPTGGWVDRGLVAALALITLMLTSALALILSLYRKKRHLEHRVASLNEHDRETGFLSREGLLEKTGNWIASNQEPFAVVSIVLNNYSYLTQNVTPDKRSAIINHIVECFDYYIKSEHLVARIEDARFILAIKGAFDLNELENIQKNLIIELIQKVSIEGETIFLTAEYDFVRFPQDATTAEALLNQVIKKYFNRQKNKNTS
ncbi:MAG: GGDEF domain-containing protein [Raoultibacter sp.]